MVTDDRVARLTALRRPPPPFRVVRVVEREVLSPRMLALGFEGEGLRSFDVPLPAASLRLVVPWPGEELEVPEWNGNEFLLADGRRPALRTFTPLDVEPAAGRVGVEVVRHPGGAVSRWAETAPLGAEAAISGPGPGYEFPAGADRVVVVGDETALPAIGQLIEMAPAAIRLDVHVEVVRPDAILELPAGDRVAVRWHVTGEGTTPGGALVEVVRALAELPAGTDVWAAGEASAMQAIRSHLFETLGVDRSRATVRGYWKPARDDPRAGTGPGPTPD